MATKNLGFLGAAERVLAEAGEPLQYREIIRQALSSGWLEMAGKTPEATLKASVRGSLHRFGAMHSTIITTGGFTKGTREASSGDVEGGSNPLHLDGLAGGR